jgi:hypothetical protein
MLGALISGIRPELPLLVGLFVLVVVLRFPMPGRGPGWQRRDAWRTFKGEARRIVFARAGGRCEATAFLVWGRCRGAATEVDHVYPWSKGGATVVSNGQALCRHHNRAKSSWSPAWWYLVALERRRRTYFPAGVDVRVFARMTEADRALRAAWTVQQGRGLARGRRRF